MMATIRRCLSLLVLAAVALCGQVALSQGCLSGTLADEFTADRLGLNRDWIIQLPSMAPGRRLESVSIGDGLVVAETGDGTVHAIQAASPNGVVPLPGSPAPGSLLWSQPVGGSGGRLETAGIGRDLVVVTQNKDVHGLERTTGRPRWLESTKSLATTGAAAIGTWVYAPNGGGMTRFAATPLRQPVDAPQPTPAADSRQDASSPPAAQAAAKKTKGKQSKKMTESLLPSSVETGGVVAYPPVPLREGLLWCTTDGVLVALQPTDVEWRRLEFALENPPAGPPVVRDRSIFAATTNGDLARIELPEKLTKRSQLVLAWHAVLPTPPDSGPFVSGDTVVVSLGELGIAAYSAETGTQAWQTCIAGTILSVGGGRVWLIDRVGRLASLDLADGMRRDTLCLGPFSIPLVNVQDDRLLLASPSGLIVSLSPRTATAVPAAEEPTARTAPANPAADAEPMPDTEPMPEAEPGTEEMMEPDANQ